MNRRVLSPRLLHAAYTVLLYAPAWALGQSGSQSELGGQRTLKAPEFAQVRDQVGAWLAEQQLDDQVRVAALALWETAPAAGESPDLLNRLAQTAALVDGRSKALVDLCSRPRRDVRLADQSWLADEAVPPLVRCNLRLLYGRWLAQEQLFDEALLQLDSLVSADVVDPATLLFYQGVVHHRLLNKEPGLKAIGALLDEVADSPRRYTTLASLIKQDLSALEDDSLDHIARRMDDVRRRLELGRAGKKVRGIEDGVVASLDKLIEEIERQQQQQQQSGASGGNQIRSRSPAQDSVPIAGRGPGEVDRRNIGASDGWGNLPPHAREAALQPISKDFPAHYRDAIEQYFRKLASQREQP